MHQIEVTAQEIERSMSTYEISFDPVQDKSIKNLPRKAKDLLQELHEMVHSNPKLAIPKLNKAIRKYPNVPALYNFLAAAYGHIGAKENYHEETRKLYKRFPDYLFGRLLYAELCLQKGEYEKVPEILNHKFELKLLYPKRSKFHVSEVASFLGVIGLYLIEIGRRDAAKAYLSILKRLDPEHVAYIKLKRKLSPLSTLTRILQTEK